MSFTRLLAAGRSVIGIKREPGPYRMNQEHLLPRFEPASVKPTSLGGEKQPPADAETAHPSTAAVVVQPVPSIPGADRSARTEKKRSAGGVFARLVRRLARLVGRRSKSQPSVAHHRHPVQTELSLDGIMVVRNDLTDSDFEVVSTRSKAGAGQGRTATGAGNNPALGVVWNRLSARLLRQAVQDFNVVQKERGKLLSQAGSVRGSPRGS